MNDRDIRNELEAKAAEMLRQQELAPKDDDGLDGYDKTIADSFPASDPPELAVDR
jgi:hypothetical protein